MRTIRDDAVRRIAALAAQGAPGLPMELLVEQVQSSIDVVVHVARQVDGSRAVVEVAELAAPGSNGARRVDHRGRHGAATVWSKQAGGGVSSMLWVMCLLGAAAAAGTLLPRRWRERQVRARLAMLPARGRSPSAWMLDAVTRRARRKVAAADDVAPTLDEIARAMAGGDSMATAMDALGPAPPQRPFAALLAPAVHQHQLGTGLADALGAVATRSPSAPEVELGVTALEVAARHGGNPASALDRVAAAVRERRAVVAERAVHSAQARLSALVLTLLPVGFAMWLVATDERARGFLVSNPVGWACVAAGLGLNVAGWLWMRRVIRGRP